MKNQYAVLFTETGQYVGPFATVAQVQAYLDQGYETFNDTPPVKVIELATPDWAPAV